jgi:hypothetical protein
MKVEFRLWMKVESAPDTSPEPPEALDQAPLGFMQPIKIEGEILEGFWQPEPDYQTIPDFDEISTSIVEFFQTKGDFTPLDEVKPWFDLRHHATVEYIHSFVDPTQRRDYMREILNRMVDEGKLISKKVSGLDMWRESYGASFDLFKDEMDEMDVPEGMEMEIPDGLPPIFPQPVAAAMKLPDSEEDEDEFEDLTRPPTFVAPKPRPRPRYDDDKQLRDTVQRLIDEGEELDWETLRDSFPDVDQATFDNVRSVSRSISSVRSGFEQAPSKSRSRSPPDSDWSEAEDDIILEGPIVSEPFIPHLEPESDIFQDPTPEPQMYNIPDDWGNDPAPTETEVSKKGGYVAPILIGLIFFWLANQAT